jgi:hypothetical protein
LSRVLNFLRSPAVYFDRQNGVVAFLLRVDHGAALFVREALRRQVLSEKDAVARRHL